MRVIKQTALVVIAIVLLAAGSFGQGQTVDKIVAVVGDQVILASELANQVQLAALQMGMKPKNQAEVDSFQVQVLEQMVSDRLFLLAAREDTMVTVRTEEIDAALDEQVARISQNFGSYDDFLAALADEGLTLRELKKRYRTDVENQMLKQRYIQRRLSSVSVSKQEVREFYETFQDSIPDQPEAVKLAHILLPIEPSKAVDDSVKQYITELRQRIIDGADFAVISSQYSTGSSGANGGDLGYLSRSDVVPEFARAAFNLNVGDISGVIRTQFGYHVIKCEGQRDDRLHLRHLLVEVPPSSADTALAYQLADSLLNVIRNGGNFEEIAKAFSTDDDTRAQGGELGWFASERLPVEFTDAVAGWNSPGECRGPIATQYGLHLLKLLDYQSQRKYSLEEDFDRLKELARQDKTGRLVDEWIEDFKKETYISYRMDE